MPNSRPSIPSRVKRKVRQRCGFGCVICGLPIYEYDHLPGYAKVKRHRADELTLLCPNHHAEKTKGLLSEEQIIEFNKSPHNLQHGLSAPYKLHYSGQSPSIEAAGITFRCSEPKRPTYVIPVVLHKVPLFGFTIDTNGVMLNMEVLDSEGKGVLRIRDSEILVSTTAWDVTWVGQTLKIHEGLRNSIVEVEFSPPDKFIVKKYRIAYRDTLVEIDKTLITIQRGSQEEPSRIGGISTTFDGNVGVCVGELPRGLSAFIRG